MSEYIFVVVSSLQYFISNICGAPSWTITKIDKIATMVILHTGLIFFQE